MQKRLLKVLLDVIDQQQKTLGNNVNFFEEAGHRDVGWASIVDQLKDENSRLIESVETHVETIAVLQKGGHIAPKAAPAQRLTFLSEEDIEQHPRVVSLCKRVEWLESRFIRLQRSFGKKDHVYEFCKFSLLPGE